MWSLKSKCSSFKTPRYLVQHFCLTFCLLKWKFIFLVICFLGDQKITISVLLTFKAVLFVWSHWTRFHRSKFIFLLMFLRELLAYYNRFEIIQKSKCSENFFCQFLLLCDFCDTWNLYNVLMWYADTETPQMVQKVRKLLSIYLACYCISFSCINDFQKVI